ncbi:hypothetical protein SCHPADRAFT_531350 [Schizopora paradoxa]|uniref:Zn(2)-C6 fungal-type domain-containing protein n=1 Tax=Schizopora paradoxa TaxID=27342 RepID=A0A0H2REZ3_9AGAM|nr:hypothetical protein SCHPADRAFT_531350 [Schizopora paradoxa]
MSRSNRLNAKNPEDARIIVGELTSALDKARLRKRAEQACTECSKHHRKCETDEGKSRCKRCDKNNIDCSFSARVSPSDHDSDSPTARGFPSTRGGYRSHYPGAAPAAVGGGYVHQSVDPRHAYADPRYAGTHQSASVSAQYPSDLSSQYPQYNAYNNSPPGSWSGSPGAPPQVQGGGMHGWNMQQQQQHPQHAVSQVPAGQVSYNTGHGHAYPHQPSAVQQRFSSDGTYYEDHQQMDPMLVRYPPPGQSYGQYISQAASGGSPGLGYYQQ